MHVLTATEMRACDERTVEETGTSWHELMENAGASVAAFAQKQFPQARRITVLCGKGNNGGDGLVAARYLSNDARQVRVVLLYHPEELTGEPAAMYDLLPERLRRTALVTVGDHALPFPALDRCLENSDLFIDAIFGTGFHAPLRGFAAELRARIASQPGAVLSVDLPSGWDADATETRAAEAFRSDAVITFTAPKPAHVCGNLTRGPIVVAPIGSPEEAILSEANLTWAGTSKKLIEVFRPLDSHKGRYGHVLVAGGSPGKAGAAAMATMAALRVGAGLATVAVPRGVASIVAGFAPEMMTHLLEETTTGCIAQKNAESQTLQTMLEGIDVLAVGPGLGRNAEAAEFARKLVTETTLPLVLDADGLNAFAGMADTLNGGNRTLVLTPHPGEMARLLGSSIADVERNRITTAREFATSHHCTLVLKGWRTLIAHPDGRVAVNTSGNPALAKGGSGDVLTGLVAGLIAQFPDRVAEAVECAVWLHGAAADIFVRTHDEHTMFATDILRHLSQAILRPVAGDGVVWLQDDLR